jgi:hypothetical protein
MNTFIKENNNLTFNEAIENLLNNIRKDYRRWSNPDKFEGTLKEIRLRSIDRFNDSVKVVRGRKYTKVMQGNSVWGFIANGDGVLKGLRYEKGDVFKAATWRGPAKHVRGSIFAEEQNYFQWTGPNYML